MSVVRRFRGTIACAIRDSDPSDANYLSPESADRVERWANDPASPYRIPICMEHNKETSGGYIIRGSCSRDEKDNLDVAFEVDNPFALQCIDFKHTRLQWGGLSLSRIPGPDIPVEVSLCVGDSGKRPGTRITHEWNYAESKWEPHKTERDLQGGSITIEDSSALSSSSDSVMSQNLSNVAPPSTQNNNTSTPNSLPFGQQQQQQQQQTPPPPQQQETQDGDFEMPDLGKMTEEELVKANRDYVLSSNIPKQGKALIAATIAQLIQSKQEHRAKMEAQRKHDVETMKTVFDKMAQSEQKARERRLASRGNMLNGTPPASETNPSHMELVCAAAARAAQSGRIESFMLDPVLRQTIESCSNLLEEALFHPQQQQQQQQQQPPRLNVWDDAFNKSFTNHAGKMQDNQTTSGYAPPSSYTDPTMGSYYNNQQQQQQQQQHQQQPIKTEDSSGLSGGGSRYTDSLATKLSSVNSKYSGSQAAIFANLMRDPKHKAAFDQECQHGVNQDVILGSGGGSGVIHPEGNGNKRQRG
jgi:hypothetical protein